MAAGEVLLTSAFTGTAGQAANPLSALADANNRTWWQTASGTGAQAIMNAGTPVTLTRVRLSTYGGYSDRVTGAQVHANNTGTFGAPLGTVQAVANHNFANGTTLTLPLAGAVGVGDCIVVNVLWGNSTTINSVSDGTNTYTLAKQQGPFQGDTQAVYLATNVAAAAGGLTITITWSAANSFSQGTAVEYTNVVTSGLLQATANATGTGTGAGSVISTGNLTTTTGGELLVCCMQMDGIVVDITPATNFIMDADGVPMVPSFGSYCEHAVSGIAGSYSGGGTFSGTNHWWAIMLALNAPAVGGSVLSINSRPLTGTLQNEYGHLNPGSTFQYYGYLAPSNSFGTVSDLDIICQWTPGINSAAAVIPVISPPGGQYDTPTIVTLSSITTDASIYYTLDGTTPTISSTLYTSPFPVGTTSTLKAIAVSTGLSNSRVAQAKFYIPSNFISSDTPQPDNNRGYRIWALDPFIFKDPVSGYWYLYGMDLDQTGVYTSGYIGINVYRSSDLRNWIYRSIVATPTSEINVSPFGQRVVVLYNAPNNNYVLWLQNFTSNITSFTSSSPEGPFSVASGFTNINGIGPVNADFDVYQDVSGNAYIAYQQYQTTQGFAQLTSNFQSISATNFQNYAMSATFGGFIESTHVFYRNGLYYLFASGADVWRPDQNNYWTSQNPLGPWTLGGNPFTATNDPLALGMAGTQYGFTQNQVASIAYDSQNARVLKIPGRDDGSGSGAFIYLGDRWDNGVIPPSSTSTTANMDAYAALVLPISFSGSAMSISWNPSWRLDAAFRTLSGTPQVPANFTFSGSSFSWVNIETNPACMYLDFSNSPTFVPVIRSEIITMGTPFPTSYTPIVAKSAAGFYRLRLVNASGTSFTVIPAPPFQNWNAFGIKPVNSKNIQHLQTINAVTVNSGTVSSAQATLTNIKLGDIICIRVSWKSSSGSVSSVSGTLNGNYSQVPGSLQSYYGQTTAWYYLLNSAQGNDTITAALSGSLPGVVIEATELSPWEVYTATPAGPNNSPIIDPYNPGGPRWNNLNVIQDYIDKFNSQNIYLTLPHP